MNCEITTDLPIIRIYLRNILIHGSCYPRGYERLRWLEDIKVPEWLLFIAKTCEDSLGQVVEEIFHRAYVKPYPITDASPLYDSPPCANLMWAFKVADPARVVEWLRQHGFLDAAEISRPPSSCVVCPHGSTILYSPPPTKEVE